MLKKTKSLIKSMIDGSILSYHNCHHTAYNSPLHLNTQLTHLQMVTKIQSNKISKLEARVRRIEQILVLHLSGVYKAK